MSNKLPEIGQWYRLHGKGLSFFVVAIDPDKMTVETQSYDGSTDEYAFTEWRQLAIEPAEQPENWTGALDIAEPDDLGTEITDTRRADWEEALLENEPLSAEEASADSDDYGEGYMQEASTDAANEDAAILQVPAGDFGRSDHGIVKETFSGSWHAEYMVDPGTGLWCADIFRHDVPERHLTALVSLDAAREAARNFYAQL